MERFVVYCHTNLKNNKAYVGWTSLSIDKRWKTHVKASREGSTCHFHVAIRKWGHADDVWQHEILDVLTTRNGANIAEKVWIKERNSYVDGYNQTTGGDGRSGHKLSEQTKVKIRTMLMGRKISDETRLKMSASKLGKKHSVSHVLNHAKAINKPIARCDFDGKILKSYPSLTLAALDMKSSCAGTRISEALKGVRRKSYKGYIWIRL